MAFEIIEEKKIKHNKKYKLIIIKEPNDLNKLRKLEENTKAIVIFSNDINMYSTYHFEPINATGVDVIIYGRGHCISNLRIYKPEDKFIGLFSKVRNLFIKDLKINNFKIFSDEVSGSLAGEVEELLKVNNFKGFSLVKGDAICGGLVGIAKDIVISNSNVSSSISGRGMLGGIAGQANTYQSDENTFITTLINDSYRTITSDTASNSDIGYLSERENDKILNMILSSGIIKKED